MARLHWLLLGLIGLSGCIEDGAADQAVDHGSQSADVMSASAATPGQSESSQEQDGVESSAEPQAASESTAASEPSQEPAAAEPAGQSDAPAEPAAPAPEPEPESTLDEITDIVPKPVALPRL